MPTTKSVVLSCAGIGSRLGLGQTKALIEINGRSLISWQLKLFSSVDDLRIVVGYQAADVINEVNKYRKDVIFVFNHNYFETKTGTSFYLGARHANEHVIEWDGDLVVHPDDAMLCLRQNEEFIGYSEKSSKEGVYVTLSNNNMVTSFSWDDGEYEWTGPACLRKDRVAYTSENVFNQIEKYLPIKGLKVRAMDIDTYEDYQKACEFVHSWSK